MATHALTSNLTTYDARGNAVRVAETSALFVLLSVLATIGVIAYMLFLLDPAHRGDPLPYLMVIVAESILVFQALLSMWTILASGYEPRTFEYHDARRTLMPAAAEGDDTRDIDGRPLLIDVFITVYGEDIEVVRRTIRAAVALRGAHRTWVLDDGRSDEVKEAAEQLGAWYVRRLSSTGRRPGTSTTRCRSRRATCSRSSTPTSCPTASSSSRRCRSSCPRTSRSCRRRRPTAT